MSRVLYRIVSFIVCGSPRATAPPLRIPPASGALLLFFLTTPLYLKAQDTVQLLDEVEVSAQRMPSTIQSVTPTQVMDALAIERQGALQLSDAVKQMAGVTLKDYGGVGGVKTVSARGLGSQFSAVTIDGIPVDDSQNGQVDLGRYLLGNAAYVSLSQGQEQSPLLSARAYAAGNVLNLETAEPQFWPGERMKMKVGMEAGSFGFLSPTLLWDQRWSKRLKSSFWVNWLKSNGDYPFTLYNDMTQRGDDHIDFRKHSAVWMGTVDGNLLYTIGKDHTLSAKVHYMRGEHELPGPLHLYSQTLSGQSTHEELAFVQARWKLERERWSAQLLAKLRSSYDDYQDTTPGTYAYNDYRQQEGFVSGSANVELTQWLDFSVAADGDLSHLKSNLAKRNDVTRRNLMTVAALRCHKGPFEMRMHLVGTDVEDHVKDLEKSPGFRKLTPYLSLMARLGKVATLRAFYKDSYRAPNFGELYFFQLMPPNLKPEHAQQVNLGATHTSEYHISSLDIQLSATVDGYYNRVTDKIVSFPQHSMYYWTTMNIGKVDILGVDATCELQLANLELKANYSYQHAVDHSDEKNKFYGHQIVYTPRHSGGGSLRWEHRWVNIGATAMAVGERFSMQQNIEKWRLPAYCDLGISLDRKFDLRLGTLGVRLQVLNLLNTQYEVVRSYPMMGRNWRLGITYEI